MKNFIALFLFFAVFTAGGQTISTDAQLTTQANVIRNETAAGGNTKGRIADMYQAIIDSKVNRNDSIPYGKISGKPSEITASNGITKNGNNFEVGGELLNDTTLIYGDPYTTGSSEIPRRLIFKDTDVAFKTSYNDGIDSVLLLMSFIGPAQDVNQNGIFIRAKVSDSDFRETGFLLTKDAITLASGTSNEGEGTFVSVEGGALLVSNTVGTGAYLSVGPNSTLLSSGSTSINMQDGIYVMQSINSGASPSTTYQQLFTGTTSSLSLTRSNGSQTMGFGPTGITFGTDTDGSPQTRLTIANNGVLTLQNALTATNGGTGQSSVTTGDMLYGFGSNTWGKLGIGSSGQFLRVSGGVPSWQTITDFVPINISSSGLDMTIQAEGYLGLSGSSGTTLYIDNDIIQIRAGNGATMRFSNTGDIIFETLTTSCSGEQAGTLWNDGGTLKICP